MAGWYTIAMRNFEWDDDKNIVNQRIHGIAFEDAQYAFFDEKRIIIHDERQSENEERWFCIGRAGNQILTVRFTNVEASSLTRKTKHE